MDKLEDTSYNIKDCVIIKLEWKNNINNTQRTEAAGITKFLCCFFWQSKANQ